MGRLPEIPTLTRNMILFLQETIETFCGLKGLIGSVLIEPERVNLRITKERCNLEYPGLGHSTHFRSGISGSTLRKNNHLFLELRTYRDGWKEACGVIDLTTLQNILESDPEQCKITIETVLLAAMRAEEKALEPFKKKPPE